MHAPVHFIHADTISTTSNLIELAADQITMAAKHISLQTTGGSTILGALHIGGSEIDSTAIGKPLKLHSESGLVLQSDVRIHGSVFASGASTVIESDEVRLEATGMGSSVELGGQVNIGSSMQLSGSTLQSTDPVKPLTVTGSTVRLSAADAVHVDAHTVQSGAQMHQKISMRLDVVSTLPCWSHASKGRSPWKCHTFQSLP